RNSKQSIRILRFLRFSPLVSNFVLRISCLRSCTTSDLFRLPLYSIPPLTQEPIMSTLNRRQFIHRTGAAVLAGSAISHASVRARGESPNETVVVGVMGMGRGLHLAAGFEKQANCVVKYACDTDEGRANQGAANIG